MHPLNVSSEVDSSAKLRRAKVAVVHGLVAHVNVTEVKIYDFEFHFISINAQKS